MALLARSRPAVKLIVFVGGIGSPPGPMTSWPVPLGCTAVTLRDSATAESGMPQSPVTSNSRTSPELSTGPSSRVSQRRQGIAVWKSPVGGGGGGGASVTVRRSAQSPAPGAVKDLAAPPDTEGAS
jgi:hypothetical protein